MQRGHIWGQLADCPFSTGGELLSPPAACSVSEGRGGGGQWGQAGGCHQGSDGSQEGWP